jgi:hypothetical protein
METRQKVAAEQEEDEKGRGLKRGFKELLIRARAGNTRKGFPSLLQDAVGKLP